MTRVSTLRGQVVLENKEARHHSNKKKRKKKLSKQSRSSRIPPPPGSTTTLPDSHRHEQQPSRTLPRRPYRGDIGRRLGVPKYSRKTGKVLRPTRGRLAQIHERRLVKMDSSSKK